VPLLDLALLHDRGIAGTNLTLVAFGALNAAQVLLLTPYRQDGRGRADAGPAGRQCGQAAPRSAAGLRRRAGSSRAGGR